MLAIARTDLPVFVNVIWLELTVPIKTRPKLSFAGTSFTVPFVRVIAAAPVVLGSATEAATIETAGLDGTVDGAAYVVASPLAVFVGATVPHEGEHGALFKVGAQLTPVFAPSFLTVAMNCCVALIPMRTEAGETDTEIGGGVTVMVAVPALPGSATEVAVSLTIGFEGTDAGAK